MTGTNDDVMARWLETRRVVSALLLSEAAVINVTLPTAREYARFYALGGKDTRPDAKANARMVKRLLRFAKALGELASAAAALRAEIDSARAPEGQGVDGSG